MPHTLSDLPYEVLIRVTTFLELGDIVSLLDVPFFVERLCCLVYDNKQRKEFRFQSVTNKIRIDDFDPEVYYPFYLFELDGLQSIDEKWFTSKFGHRNKIVVLHASPEILKQPAYKTTAIIKMILKNFESKQLFFLLEGFPELTVLEDETTPDDLKLEDIRNLTFKCRDENANREGTLSRDKESKLNTGLSRRYELKNIKSLKVYVSLSENANLSQFNLLDARSPESLFIHAGQWSKIASRKVEGHYYYRDVHVSPVINLIDFNWPLVSLKVESFPSMVLRNVDLIHLKKLELSLGANSKGSVIESLKAENLEEFKLLFRGISFFPVLNNSIRIGNSTNRCLSTIYETNSHENLEELFFDDGYDLSVFSNSSALIINSTFFISTLSSKNAIDIFSNIEKLVLHYCSGHMLKSIEKLSDFSLGRLSTLSITFSNFTESKLTLRLNTVNLNQLEIGCFPATGNKTLPLLTVDIMGSNLKNLKKLKLTFIRCEKLSDLNLPSLDTLELMDVFDSPSVVSDCLLNIDISWPNIRALFLENRIRNSNITVILNQKILSLLPKAKPNNVTYVLSN